MFLLFLSPFVARAQYCSAGPTSALDSNLGLVHLAGNSKTINSNNDCPGSIGVQDQTNLNADLTPGRSYTLTYDVTTCAGQYNRYSSAWIDYNGDGSFDAGEELSPAQPTTQSPNTITTQFTVPGEATLGNTRLRVMVQERSAAGMTACDQFGYGGTKDFEIILTNTVLSPGGGLSGGTEFLLIVFGGFALYLMVGMGLNYNKGYRGADMVPNLDFWKNLPDYVKVGCEVSSAKVKSCIGGLRGESSTTYDEM